MVVGFPCIAQCYHRHQGMLLHVLLSITTACTLCLLYLLTLVTTQHPWWRPQSFLVLLGMLLVGAVTTTAAALGGVLDEAVHGAGRIEFMLATGASRLEAAKPMVRAGVSVAMGPAVSAMQVLGVVCIPELMMGQILAGLSPGMVRGCCLSWVVTCVAEPKPKNTHIETRT